MPKLEARKVEVDDAAFKNAVVVSKKDEDENAYFVGKVCHPRCYSPEMSTNTFFHQTKSSVPKAKAKKEEKVFIEIDARFERPSRGGRGRGGDRGGDRGGERGIRGRGRGGGGRGRGGNGPNAPAALDDETAFPSLA